MPALQELVESMEKLRESVNLVTDCVARDSCAIVDETCGVGVTTQSDHIQGVAAGVVRELQQGDEGSLFAERVESVCGFRKTEVAKEDCRFDLLEGMRDTRLRDQFAREMGATMEFYRGVNAFRERVYRGVSVPDNHPLVKKLKACSEAGKTTCYGDVGEEYAPKVLESWSVNKDTARKFARAKAQLEDTVPIILTKMIHFHPAGTDLQVSGTHGLAAVPVTSSFNNRGCLFGEGEVLLLWLNPRAPFSGTGEWEIQIERA